MEKKKDIKSGFGRIVLEFNEGNGKRKIAFNGRWLYSTNIYVPMTIREQSVALTEKGQFLVYHFDLINKLSYYELFQSFQLLIENENIDMEVKVGVAEELGEDFIEFLDI